MNSENEFGQLVAADAALESMRDSGYDLATAVGEVVDNSIEARAHSIKIRTGFVKGQTKEITEMAFSDDGIGIPPTILQHVLTLGYSTRYNQRNSLGRFGMGLKLASISHARRIEIYTRQADGLLYHTYIDLTEISEGRQKHIEKVVVEDYPERYRDLMRDEKGKPYASGTLVVWSKIDRLYNQGRYVSSLDNKMASLLDFLARAYRYFLAQGLRIYLDGQQVFPYDPLFLMENPLVIQKGGGDYRAEVIAQKEFDIDGQMVRFIVTLLPEQFRLNRGDGGFRGKMKNLEFLHLQDKAGKVSIVRNGREIYYNILPRSMPGGRDDVDRFIGLEIKFPAQLDEYFQVRNVKRGAEPVDTLRVEFRKFIEGPVKQARKKIKDRWNKTDVETAAQTSEHQKVIQIVAQADQTAPGGKAGLHLDASAKEKIIRNILADMSIDPETQPQLAEKTKKDLLENPISIVTAGWPGNELFEIDHVEGHPIVKINSRHPFFRDVYTQLKVAPEKSSEDWTVQELIQLVNKTRDALDLLFMAYAKAESLNPNADEAYSGLRSQWGYSLASYITSLTNTPEK